MSKYSPIKILTVTALTALFVACGGAEVSFAPDAKADSTGGMSATAGNGSSTGGVSGNSAGGTNSGAVGTCACDPGEPGDPGPIGPVGPQGPAGPSGKDGTSVVCVNDLNNCPPGAPGMTGATGPAGPAGLAGRDGASCSVTDSSNVGTGQAATITCSNGTSTRLLAAAGPKGDTGAPGPVGPAGATGPVGPMGPAGKDGASIGITKGSLYVRTVSNGSSQTAFCDDENDVAISGNCNSSAVMYGFIGLEAAATPDVKAGWTCRPASLGTIVSPTVVCLKVP